MATSTTTTTTTTTTSTSTSIITAAEEREMLTGLLSCTGAPFERRVSRIITVPQFMGRDHVQMKLLTYTTPTLKDVPTVCATVVCEYVPEFDYEHHWATFSTTCDPFGHDNFTAPLGRMLLDPATGAYTRHPVRAIRSSSSPDDNNGKQLLLNLTNTFKTVEQRTYLQHKARGHELALEEEMALSEGEGGGGPIAVERRLKALMLGSRGLGTTGLRELFVDPEDDSRRIPEKAESLFTPDMTADQRSALEKAEKSALQAYVEGLPEGEFIESYMSWVRYARSGMTRTLLPAEYKKRGRWLLLSVEEVRNWNKYVFLILLGVRADLAARKSPHDFKFGTLDPDAVVHSEVSPDDARFALTHPLGLKLGAHVEAAEKGTSTWLFEQTEYLVATHGAFLARLKAMCDHHDIDGAVHLLTEGTATPYTGQALLGLAISLLRDLNLRRIVFPPALISALSALLTPLYYASSFNNDGDDTEANGADFNTWTLPLIPIDAFITTTGDAHHQRKEIAVNLHHHAIGHHDEINSYFHHKRDPTLITDPAIHKRKRDAYERLCLIGTDDSSSSPPLPLLRVVD